MSKQQHITQVNTVARWLHARAAAVRASVPAPLFNIHGAYALNQGEIDALFSKAARLDRAAMLVVDTFNAEVK